MCGARTVHTRAYLRACAAGSEDELISVLAGMSFLSLDSLFCSSTRGEVNDNEDASAVTNTSFWAATHDNDGYQDIVFGFPPGTLSGIYQEEEDSFSGTTIISSAPSSSSDIPMQQVHETQTVGTPWALSPASPTQGRVDNALSITTTESVYRNLQSLENSVNERTLSSVDLSLPDNISSAPTLISSYDQVDDGISFRNVADRLAILPQNGEWFSRFTEQDWMQFQQVANMILNALLVEPHGVTLSSEVPAAFLCGICHDIIVGATALSCGCSVCAKMLAHQGWSECTVEAAVTCPTLDVAICAYHTRLPCSRNAKMSLARD